ncbi:MAG TPA: GAF domain-containing protein [Candidatus Sulfotelmatobacter sp.]|nr:GAF domain-containing protein [Candidatus Sulfotelmatobacter sp.]
MDAAILGHIARAAINVSHGDMATVQMATGGALRLVASRGFKRDFLDYFEIVRSHESCCGAALASREPVIVDDVRESPHFVGKPSQLPLLDAGSLSVVSVPIVSRRGVLLGVVSPHRRSLGRPKPADFSRLTWLASQAADVFEGTASLSTLRGIEVLARG